MRTLIIPCAGKKRIGGIPIYLCKHPDGMIVLEKSISGIFPESYDRIVVVINYRDCEDYDAEKIIQNTLSKFAEVIVFKLSEETSGPAETVFKAIESLSIEEEISIKDSHSFILLEHKAEGNCIAGINLLSSNQSIDDFKSKSYIVKNDQGQILDIIEKRIKSEDISVGLYCFNDARDYLYAYSRLNDYNYPIKRLYVSHLISYLIGYKSKIFNYLFVKEYEDWGTGKAWERVQRKHATYFINYDKTINVFLSNSLAKAIVSDYLYGGMKFVLFSSSKTLTSEMKNNIEKCGLNSIPIILGCTNSHISEVIDTEEELNIILEGIS